MSTPKKDKPKEEIEYLEFIESTSIFNTISFDINDKKLKEDFKEFKVDFNLNYKIIYLKCLLFNLKLNVKILSICVNYKLKILTIWNLYETEFNKRFNNVG
jgi:hypothetical protein